MSINLLERTPQEFIDEESNRVREYMQQNDIQVNKVGMLGFLINLLGNTTYDVKQYYEKLFRESFIATAREDYNILMHSSIWGYKPEYAMPSTAEGSFFFDFGFMPKKSANVYKTEVIFSNISFDFKGYRFTTTANYKFVQERGKYYCIIHDPLNVYMKYISSSEPLIEAPFYNVKQKQIIRETPRIQNYEHGSFYPYVLEVDEGYLSDLSVKVKIPTKNYDTDNPDDWDEFEISSDKNFGKILEKVVFLKRLGVGRFLIEFGSGVQGLYVPNTQALITKEVTQGSAGNIKVGDRVSLSGDTNVSATDYIIDDVTGAKKERQSYKSANIKDIAYIDFDYSEGGEDLKTGEDLRNELVNYIQTRDNLLSKKDFHNVAEKYYDDFKFMFKKSQMIINTFYLHKAFRDEYLNPIRSTNLMVAEIDEVNAPTLTASTYYDTNSDLDPAEWEFYVTASDGFRETNPSNSETVYVTSTENSISLEWDDVTNAKCYFIYGKKSDETYWNRWKVTESKDIISEGDKYITDESDNEVRRESHISLYPYFGLGDYDFVSPFLYKYDPNMNWYEGYMFFDNFIVNLNQMYSKTDTPIGEMDLPIYFFNIWYDYGQARTNIDIKSTSDISNYSFQITITEMGINQVQAEQVNQNTFRYSFYDSDHGILWEQSSIELNVFQSGSLQIVGSTAGFNQIISIVDQLRLFRYSTATEDYILSIPLIERDKFNNDRNYYLNKLKEFLSDMSFDENRMPADDISFAFLNSHRISSDKLRYLTKQEYDSFDLELPLKLDITIYADQKKVINENINLTDKREELENRLSTLLLKTYTGSEIEVYGSQIVDFIHEEEGFAKYVVVNISDNKGTTISEGLETQAVDNIINKINNDDTLGITDRKLKILEYVPPYFYWDLDDINVEVFLQ